MPKSDTNETDLGVRTLGLLLVDGFALMSYASVVEPFRAANVLAGRELYRWTHVSAGGRSCRASNDAVLLADQDLDRPPACDLLFVFAAGDLARASDPATLAWLRQAARTGAVIAGVSAGPFLMAQAGLLDGHRATIHWDHREAFAEAFPMLTLDPGLYVIDRRRVTCAGGMAGMDLAVELIERQHGHALAAQVSDWFIQGEPRAANRPQRQSLRARYGLASDGVLKALAAMEASVEEPVSRMALARVAGVSLRQLERLFSTHLHETISARYLRLRLEQARQLLRTTGLTTIGVGLACGFRSSSHFSRAYRTLHGRSPSEERRPAGRSGTDRALSAPAP